MYVCVCARQFFKKNTLAAGEKNTSAAGEISLYGERERKKEKGRERETKRERERERECVCVCVCVYACVCVCVSGEIEYIAMKLLQHGPLTFAVIERETCVSD